MGGVAAKEREDVSVVIAPPGGEVYIFLWLVLGNESAETLGFHPVLATWCVTIRGNY